MKTLAILLLTCCTAQAQNFGVHPPAGSDAYKAYAEQSQRVSAEMARAEAWRKVHTKTPADSRTK